MSYDRQGGDPQRNFDYSRRGSGQQQHQLRQQQFQQLNGRRHQEELLYPHPREVHSARTPPLRRAPVAGEEFSGRSPAGTPRQSGLSYPSSVHQPHQQQHTHHDSHHQGVSSSYHSPTQFEQKLLKLQLLFDEVIEDMRSSGVGQKKDFDLAMREVQREVNVLNQLKQQAEQHKSYYQQQTNVENRRPELAMRQPVGISPAGGPSAYHAPLIADASSYASTSAAAISANPTRHNHTTPGGILRKGAAAGGGRNELSSIAPASSGDESSSVAGGGGWRGEGYTPATKAFSPYKPKGPRWISLWPGTHRSAPAKRVLLAADLSWDQVLARCAADTTCQPAPRVLYTPDGRTIHSLDEIVPGQDYIILPSGCRYNEDSVPTMLLEKLVNGLPSAAANM